MLKQIKENKNQKSCDGRKTKIDSSKFVDWNCLIVVV